MKTCTLSEAKSSLGKLADAALQGRPTVINRGGKLVILQAYQAPDAREFDSMIDAGIESKHMPLNREVWEGIRRRGTKLADDTRKKRSTYRSAFGRKMISI